MGFEFPALRPAASAAVASLPHLRTSEYTYRRLNTRHVRTLELRHRIKLYILVACNRLQHATGNMQHATGCVQQVYAATARALSALV